MTHKAWTAVRLDEIPSSAEIPVEGLALSREEETRALRERDPAAVARFEKFNRLTGASERTFHAVRRYLGIGSFGVNAAEAPAGTPLIVPHDETQYGQEELYLVVRGRARFVCDGEEVELGPGELLYARPEVHREATALEERTLLLLVGGVPGKAYEPPTWSRDWRPSATPRLPPSLD